MSSGFDIKGIEDGLKVLSKLVKELFFGVNGGIGHLVISHLREIDTLTLIHLVQNGHDFDFIGGV